MNWIDSITELLKVTLPWCFGFMLIGMLWKIGNNIALGQVQKDTSYGLDIILGGLVAALLGFIHWAFGAVRDYTRRSQP